MKTKLLCIALCAMPLACSEDDSSDSSKRAPGFQAVDLDGFKNTADRDTLVTKAKKSKSQLGLFEGLRSNNTITTLLQAYNDESCETVSTESTLVEDRSALVTKEDCELNAVNGSMILCQRTTTEFADNGETVVEQKCSDGSYSRSSTRSTDSTQSSGQSSAQTSDFQDVQNCQDAFDNIDSLYQETSTALDQVVAMLENPEGQFNLSGGGAQLTEAKADDQAAVAYKMEPMESMGMKLSGSLSGGANDNIVLVKMSYDMTMSQMNGGIQAPKQPHNQGFPRPRNSDVNDDQTSDMGDSLYQPLTLTGLGGMRIVADMQIASNLETKVIEMLGNGKVEIKSDDGGLTMSNKSHTIISAGDEAYIEETADMTMVAQGADPIAVNAKARVTIKDENTLAFTAHVNTGSQAGKLSFDLQRDEYGCEVKNVKNDLPQVQN